MKRVRTKKDKLLKGFTLMEMMVVIAIMFIVIAIAMPNFWGGRGSAEHKGAARRITSTLRIAKGYAEAQNDTYDVLMSITDPDGDGNFNFIGMDIYKTSYVGYTSKVDKTEKMTLSAPFHITTILDNSPGAYFIKFNPEGSADDGDGAAPSNETITIQNKTTGKSIIITISEDTGCISIGDLQ